MLGTHRVRMTNLEPHAGWSAVGKYATAEALKSGTIDLGKAIKASRNPVRTCSSWDALGNLHFYVEHHRT